MFNIHMHRDGFNLSVRGSILTFACMLVLPKLAVASCDTSCATASSADCAVIKAPIYHAQKPTDDAYYFARLLSLALDLTVDDFGDYCLQTPAAFYSDNRLKVSAQQGLVDVLWLVANSEHESQLQPIRIPLLGELNYYRMLLIRPEDEPRFAKVQTLEDLRTLTGGMNSQWADAQIMAENGLPYVESTGYGKLFRMLAGGRFDYFSRGIYQISLELNFYPELDLMIAPDLLLKYPSFTYFFVRNGDQRLAQRIELGLKRAQKNGQFESLFQSFERFRWAEQQLLSSNLRVIPLSRQWQGGQYPPNKVAAQ